MDSMELCYNLRRLRKSLKLSAGDVGLFLHVNKQTIYRFEQGKQLPDAFQISELAYLYGCEISDLYKV